MKRSTLNQENGSAFIMTLILVLFLAILGTSIAFIMGNEIKQAIRYNHKVQSFYYAVSGIEIAFGAMLSEETFLEMLSKEEDEFFIVLSAGLDYFDGENIQNEDVLVTILLDRDNLKGEIISNGAVIIQDRESAISDERIQEFFWSGIGTGSGTGSDVVEQEELLNPDVEDPNMVSAGLENLGWHFNGTLNNMNDTSLKPVIWTDNQQLIVDKNNSPFTLQAPIMYFLDEWDEYDSSIYIEDNARRRLFKADLFMFKGNVLFQFHSQHGVRGEFNLGTYNSTLEGSDLTGLTDLNNNSPISDINYGLIYFNRGVINDIGENIRIIPDPNPHNLKPLEPGFYYFPSDVNLGISHIPNTSEYGLERLIKIDDYETINFDKLGIAEYFPADLDFNFGTFI